MSSWTVLVAGSSHRRCSLWKGVLRNCAKSTEKHLRQSLFLNKVAGWGLQLYFKRDSTTGGSCRFCEISNNNLFTKHHWVTVSVWSWYYLYYLGCYWRSLDKQISCKIDGVSSIFNFQTGKTSTINSICW